MKSKGLPKNLIIIKKIKKFNKKMKKIIIDDLLPKGKNKRKGRKDALEL